MAVAVGTIGSPVTGTGSALYWTATQNRASSYVVLVNKSGCPNNCRYWIMVTPYSGS